MGWLDIAAGIVGGGIVGGINDQRQLNQQQELTNIQKEAQLDIWNKTNYEAQVKHAKAAGLNPAMLYGKGGAGGTTGSISGGAAPSGGREIQDIAALGLQGQAIQSQIELNKANAKKAEADAAKTAGVDTEKTGAEIKQIGATITNTIQDTKNKEAQQELTESQTALVNIEKAFQYKTFGDRADAIEWNAKEAYEKYMQANNQTYIAKSTRDAAIGEIKARAIGAVIANNLMNAQIGKVEAETTNINKDTEVKDNQIREIWSKISLLNEQQFQLIHDRTMDWENLSVQQKQNALKEISVMWETNVDKWSAEMNIEIGKGISQVLSGMKPQQTQTVIHKRK